MALGFGGKKSPGYVYFSDDRGLIIDDQMCPVETRFFPNKRQCQIVVTPSLASYPAAKKT